MSRIMNMSGSYFYGKQLVFQQATSIFEILEFFFF